MWRSASVALLMCTACACCCLGVAATEGGVSSSNVTETRYTDPTEEPLAVLGTPEPETRRVPTEKKKEKLSTGTLVTYIIADLILLCFAALFAGLTLSVMGLDTLSLEIIATSGQEPDKTYATKILPIRKKGNQLLCTLILGNVMVNTLIAQITDRFISGWIGVAVSTAMITVGGEILPQATMAAHALKVGASSAGVVKFFLFIFYPVCRPISIFLNRTIGEDPGQIYERAELKKLFAIHAQEHGAESGLAASDLDLLFGAMDLGSVTVADVMTPLADVFMLEASERLDADLLQMVWQSGHSRIPVYKTQRINIVGVLYAKDLLMVDPDEGARIHDFIKFHQRHIVAVSSETSLMAMLRQFQTGSSHMALVRRVAIRAHGDPIYESVGIITLDDVIARLIGAEIRDDDSGSEEDGDRGDATTGAHHAHHTGAHHGGVALAGTVVTPAAAALYGSPAARADRTLGSVSGAALRLVRASKILGNQQRAMLFYLRESVPAFATVDADALAEFVADKGLSYDIMAPTSARGLKSDNRRNVWLYQIGHRSNMFTLVMNGGAQVLLPAAKEQASPLVHSPTLGHDLLIGAKKRAEPLYMDLPSWSALGMPLLDAAARQESEASYVPDFSARVVSMSTVLQLHFSDLREFFQQQKSAAAR